MEQSFFDILDKTFQCLISKGLCVKVKRNKMTILLKLLLYSTINTKLFFIFHFDQSIRKH